MLAEAVDKYIAQRRLEGARFVGAEMVFRALCRRFRDLTLEHLSSGQLEAFVNSPRGNPSTSLGKYSTVKCFLAFWHLRGKTTAGNIARPARCAAPAAPFIYTETEIRALLNAASQCQKKAGKMSSITLRTLLLTMYATGATVDEILLLRRSRVDVKRRRIGLGFDTCRVGRIVPIGSDLLAELRTYIAANRRPQGDDYIFQYVAGRRIGPGYLHSRFRRLVQIAKIARKTGRAPRMQDLRYTFAVHRITSCIRRKGDLNELIPALSTYMGYASLTKSEQFLAFAPERFRDDLSKLNPQKGRTRWRDRPALMSKLAAL